jgi:hypothetical protein
VLLFYVSLVIPLRTCFEVEIDVASVPFIFDALVDIYFIAVWDS